MITNVCIWLYWVQSLLTYIFISLSKQSWEVVSSICADDKGAKDQRRGGTFTRSPNYMIELEFNLHLLIGYSLPCAHTTI